MGVPTASATRAPGPSLYLAPAAEEPSLSTQPDGEAFSVRASWDRVDCGSAREAKNTNAIQSFRARPRRRRDLRDLEDAERARLAAELETLNLKRGDVLVRQGETADALYIVVTGRFVVTLDGRREPVAELGPGQPVGEIAFLAGGVRTATVTALRDSLVLRLGRAEFERAVGEEPRRSGAR